MIRTNGNTAEIKCEAEKELEAAAAAVDHARVDLDYVRRVCGPDSDLYSAALRILHGAQDTHIEARTLVAARHHGVELLSSRGSVR